MKLTQDERLFLENLANSDTGVSLIKLLEKIEVYYADIRNLEQVAPEVRKDALKMFRSLLLDKLLVLRGEIDPPGNDEWD